jgi:hypothetical protein
MSNESRISNDEATRDAPCTGHAPKLPRLTGEAAKNAFPRTNSDKKRHEAVSPRNSALRKSLAPVAGVQNRVKNRRKRGKTWKTDGFSRVFPATQDEG